MLEIGVLREHASLGVLDPDGLDGLLVEYELYREPDLGQALDQLFDAACVSVGPASVGVRTKLESECLERLGGLVELCELVFVVNTAGHLFSRSGCL